jgi:hypothetical protein
MRRGVQATAGLIGFALAIALPHTVQAQDVPASQAGKRIFKPEEFATYAPVSALDMVRRIPGFSIEGSEGRRGFGENAGNVLIDGDRPSTKSDDIFVLLSRIPASQVAYIELSEQAGADGEAQGKGQVVNVIRKKSDKLSGTYEAGYLTGRRGKVTPFAGSSATLRRGNTTYEANLDFFWEQPGAKGPEDFYDGQRRFIERRTYRNLPEYMQVQGGFGIKTRIGGAKINANAKATWNDGGEDRLGFITDAAGRSTGFELLATDAPITDLAYEFGGDVEFTTLPKLNTKLIGLYRAGTESQGTTISTDRINRPRSSLFFGNRNKPSETVLRVQNDWSGLNAHAIQFGAEYSTNRLDSRFAQTDLSGTTPIILPGSDVLVRETRLEPFISDVWTVSPQWKIESGAIFEFSRLRLSGASVASRSFQFIKPRIIATWSASKRTTFEFRADHQIAQLNFEEFATSVDAGAGNQVDAGNADLVPDRVTTLSALVRHKFLERGSIQLLGSYEMIQDTQDLVPITIRDAQGKITAEFDGTGNIGDGKRWNAELEITLPFDWMLGIKGIELKYVGHYHGSRVTDPVTGLNRRVSNRPLWHQQFELRHNVGKTGFAWGADVFVAAPSNAYFLNQYRWQNNRQQVSAFVEYSKFRIGTIKLKAFNLTGSGFERQRFIYAGRRGQSPIGNIILRQRRENIGLQVQLTGKF